MNLHNSVIVSIQALKRNKMRTALTCIGIVIGVASVIIMVGIGNSARIAVREKVSAFGTNALSILTWKKPFTEDDLRGLKANIPEIQYITPMNSWEYTVKYKNRNIQRKIYGVSNDYFFMNNWELTSGNYFTETEVMTSDKVVVIGHAVKEKLFEGEDPIGKVIQINGIPFRVTGCLKERGMGLTGQDLDNFILSPYSTVSKKLFGTKDVFLIFVATYDESQIDYAKDEILAYLRRRYNLSDEQMQGYKIATSKEARMMAEQITLILTNLLAGIASISLFVGGVGIMNIMLASVSERTREIGIRMAIGAKNRDILLQFLIEALIISMIGGISGIILGLLMYLSFTSASRQPFIFSPSSIIVSFLFAASVGIIFGYYPAKKASRLNPIDALRHE